MKNLIATFVILSIFTGIGCLNDSKSKVQQAEPASTIVAPLISDTNANKTQTSPSTTTPLTITSKPVSTAKLNPAHGQPGHRCDIEVGAPLDSKPVQTSLQTQPAVKPTTTTPLSIPTATGNGLNPAHGQPGHRCDIAVGAPLNSKPTQ
jgi:hypothetical protein